MSLVWPQALPDPPPPVPLPSGHAALLSAMGPCPEPWHPHPGPSVLAFSSHLDTRLALAFPLGLFSKVTSSEGPPRTAVSKPAPCLPPLPRLLLLSSAWPPSPCLSVPCWSPASFSTLRVAEREGASALPPPPLPGAFAGGGCLHRSARLNRVPARLGLHQAHSLFKSHRESRVRHCPDSTGNPSRLQRPQPPAPVAQEARGPR